MSEIKHEPQFAGPKRVAITPEMQEFAGAVARLFLGNPDGKIVLRKLREKFGLGRSCFEMNNQGRYDYLAAAVTDGQRQVMLFIEGALALARPEHPDVKEPI